MKRIAITSEKDWVGKSTLTFNLAGALATNSKVTLIDEDLRVRSCIQLAELKPVLLQVLTPG